MVSQIKGGYIMIARKIDQSHISEAPPYAREIWFYLLRAANHQDSEECERGQTIRRYIDIIEALKWYVGYRKCTYSVAQCENAMKLLVKANMIAKTRTTRGLLITICNYSTYQNAANYESQFHEATARATMEPQGCQTINKKVKKEKKEKNDNKYMGFDEFWELYPKKKAKQDARKAWLKLDLSEQLVEIIVNHVSWRRYTNDWVKDAGKFCPLPATFLNGHRWEDVIASAEMGPKTCVVCRQQGHKYQSDAKGQKVWLCKNCNAGFRTTGLTSWGKLTISTLECKVLEGKAKLEPEPLPIETPKMKIVASPPDTNAQRNRAKDKLGIR